MLQAFIWYCSFVRCFWRARVCVCVLFIGIVQRSWACLTWKSALEIKSLLLLLCNNNNDFVCPPLPFPQRPSHSCPRETSVQSLSPVCWSPASLHAPRAWPEARCPARRMLVNAREWRNNASWSGVAYTTSGSKARSNARWRGRSLTFKTRWRMCFSGFRTSRSPSFVFMKTFSLFFFFDRTRTAVKVIYLLISVQFIFFHALWMAIFLSFYFS